MKNILKNIYNDIMHIKTFIIIFIIAFILLNLLFHKICLISIITGFPCPGCGMTRAIGEIFKLNLIGALEYNIFSVFMFIFILLSCVFILIDIFKNSNKYLTFMKF